VDTIKHEENTELKCKQSKKKRSKVKTSFITQRYDDKLRKVREG